MGNTLTDTKIYKVHHKRELTDSTFVLRFDRHGLNFQAGQHILVGRSVDDEMREYSIYSCEQDDFLEILVKEVEDGVVSKQLKNLKPGDPIQVEGAVGFFRISEDDLNKKFLFIASGTGIAPFHSFANTYKKLDYKLLHGVRYAKEAYEKNTYEDQRHILCCTQDDHGDFLGRVTDYIKMHPVDQETLVYLCGNSNMILDTKDLLEHQGVPHDHIHTEVYF